MASVLSAFGEEHVVRLTGLTKRQLRYWNQISFFSPGYAVAGDKSAFSRIYSFRDVVALRILSVLRNQFCVPLQQLRKVSHELEGRAVDRWTGTKLWVVNKKVVWQEAGTNRPQEVLSKQLVLPVDLTEVISATKRDIGILQKRERSDIGKVRRSRGVSHNAPVIAGTRIRVQAIEEYLKAGFSNKQIIAEYPDLTAIDISAVRRETKRLAA